MISKLFIKLESTILIDNLILIIVSSFVLQNGSKCKNTNCVNMQTTYGVQKYENTQQKST